MPHCGNQNDCKWYPVSNLEIFYPAHLMYPMVLYVWSYNRAPTRPGKMRANLEKSWNFEKFSKYHFKKMNWNLEKNGWLQKSHPWFGGPSIQFKIIFQTNFQPHFAQHKYYILIFLALLFLALSSYFIWYLLLCIVDFFQSVKVGTL